MIEGSDYAQQTSFVGAIDDTLINELMRTTCYNQTIYDDMSLELDEYLGLSLGVQDLLTTVRTIVQPMFDQAAILIIDNDRAFKVVHITTMDYTLTFLIRGCCRSEEHFHRDE